MKRHESCATAGMFPSESGGGGRWEGKSGPRKAKSAARSCPPQQVADPPFLQKTEKGEDTLESCSPSNRAGVRCVQTKVMVTSTMPRMALE